MQVADPNVETFTYNDTIVRWFTIASLFWAIVAFLLGVILSFQLVLPQLNFGGTPLGEYLSFGRLRPLHTNAAIFAFVGNAIFAGVYYSTQRLCKARMWSDTLGWLNFWGWQGIIVSAALSFPLA
jgi:cytochrome c oxidase cbb3-type subunit I/II